jgi:hypothetical protein
MYGFDNSDDVHTAKKIFFRCLYKQIVKSMKLDCFSLKELLSVPKFIFLNIAGSSKD